MQFLFAVSAKKMGEAPLQPADAQERHGQTHCHPRLAKTIDRAKGCDIQGKADLHTRESNTAALSSNATRDAAEDESLIYADTNTLDAGL